MYMKVLVAVAPGDISADNLRYKYLDILRYNFRIIIVTKAEEPA